MLAGVSYIRVCGWCCACMCTHVCVKRHRSINLTTTSNPDNRQLSPVNTVTH